MTTEPSFAGFTSSRAHTYDDRVRKHIPGYEVLHAIAETLLAKELPEKASVLAVGVGTGAEILEWGAKHPGWQFVGTDPAEAMVAQAQEKLAVAGLIDRTRLHVGDVTGLPEDAFDAATLLLVLHFVPAEEKVVMMESIADRLKPGAPLLVANLFGEVESTRFKRLTDARKAWAVAKGLPAEMAEEFCNPQRPDMHITTEEDMKKLLRNAGFIDIQRVFQALTVAMWFARAPR